MPGASRRRYRSRDIPPPFKCSSQRFLWNKRKGHQAESPGSVAERRQSLSLRGGELSKPWRHPGPHLSPGAARSWTCSRCAALHLAWETARIWGDQLASEGAPTPTNNQPKQAGKHHRTDSQWAVLLVTVAVMWSGRLLLLSRDSKVFRRRITNPCRTTKAHLVVTEKMLGFRESVSTTSSLGIARHPTFMSAAAQRDLSCPGRTKAIVERGPLASLPSAWLPTLWSQLNICIWPPTVPPP